MLVFRAVGSERVDPYRLTAHRLAIWRRAARIARRGARADAATRARARAALGAFRHGVLRGRRTAAHLRRARRVTRSSDRARGERRGRGVCAADARARRSSRSCRPAASSPTCSRTIRRRADWCVTATLALCLGELGRCASGQTASRAARPAGTVRRPDESERVGRGDLGRPPHRAATRAGRPAGRPRRSVTAAAILSHRLRAGGDGSACVRARGQRSALPGSVSERRRRLRPNYAPSAPLVGAGMVKTDQDMPPCSQTGVGGWTGARNVPPPFGVTRSQ